MGRIIDSMQAPIGSLAAGNAQHRGIVDAELGPGSRFGSQSLSQQMRQDPLQQRRSFTQTVQDGGVFQFESRLGRPGGRASQGEVFHGVC